MYNSGMNHLSPKNALSRRVKYILGHCTKKGSIDVWKTAQHLLSLQRGLTGNRNLAGVPYMDNPDTLNAYLFYYWPVSFLQTWYALDSIPGFTKRFESLNKISILDFGSGPAPGTVAALDYFFNATKNHAKYEITLADSSEKALSLAQKILASDKGSISKIITVRENFEKTETLNSISGDDVNAGQRGEAQKKFDLIIASHSINELWKKDKNRNQKIFALMQSLCAYLNDGGILLVIEPAVMESSRTLITLRDMMKQSGFSVLSPCPENEGGTCQCPALKSESGTCHAEREWISIEPASTLARFAKLDRESVKMTYFAFARPMDNESLIGNEGPIENEAAASTLTESAPKNDCAVVSDAMLNKSGRVRFILCDGKRRFAFSAKKDLPEATRQGFFELKRYDRIKVENPEIRQGNEGEKAWGFVPETKIVKL